MEEMGVGQARIDKHYQAYRDIIAGSDTWRAAADKFGLAPDPQAGMREERRRA